MSESGTPSPIVSPLLQPRLSHVLTHLQPNLAECVLGIDPSSLRLIHLALHEASPLLVLGDPAMGTVNLATSLLVQLYAMNDPSHLQVVVLDRPGPLASLVQFLPQTCAAATTDLDMLQALQQANRLADGADQAGPQLAVVVVNEFLDLHSDPNAWSAFRTLAAHGHERGIALIALSQAGDNDIALLCRQRIAFASEQPGATSSGGFLQEQTLRAVLAAQQRGQFLVEGVERQGSKQLVLPLIDILALHVEERNGVRFLQRSPAPIACAGLEALFSVGGRREPAEFLERLAAHVRTCSRCRHGFLPLAEPIEGIASLSCSACSSLLPTYYEATHPNHPQVSMPPAELFQVANHLGQCPACCEVWGSLVQISFLEEEGLPSVE